MILRETHLALTVATIFDSLNVRYGGKSIVTSNFGRTYSATWKTFVNIWPDKTAVMFQSPRTGWSDSWSSDAKTPCLVKTRFHCLTRFPFPSCWIRNTIAQIAIALRVQTKNIYKDKKLRSCGCRKTLLQRVSAGDWRWWHEIEQDDPVYKSLYPFE